jgi:hypothetical protein
MDCTSERRLAVRRWWYAAPRLYSRAYWLCPTTPKGPARALCLPLFVWRLTLGHWRRSGARGLSEGPRRFPARAVLWLTRLPLLAKLAVFYTIELCWNPWVDVSIFLAWPIVVQFGATWVSKRAMGLSPLTRAECII